MTLDAAAAVVYFAAAAAAIVYFAAAAAAAFVYFAATAAAAVSHFAAAAADYIAPAVPAQFADQLLTSTCAHVCYLMRHAAGSVSAGICTHLHASVYVVAQPHC